MRIIQIVYGTVPAELEPRVASVRAAFADYGYDLIALPAIHDPITRCMESDRARFNLAREYGPEMLYCDLDVEILAPWPIEPGAHFGFQRGQPGCFLFYGLTPEFLDKMDADMAARKLSPDTYCWPAKALRDRHDAIQIPDRYFVHHGYTHKAQRV
jgi:hypothetical protein